MTIGPTALYIHAGTLLFAGYALVSGAFPLLLCASVSILLHEAAHGAAAALAGEPPLEMELTPLGAVLRLEDEERMPAGKRLLMLAAGPVMTLLLCFLSLRMTEWGVLTADHGRLLFTSNLAILMMNLLPALPLDGGRIAALLLSGILRGETVRRVMRICGTLLGSAAILGSVWLAWRYGAWNLSLAGAGCFLMYAAQQSTTSAAMSELRALMDRKLCLERKGSMLCCRVAVLGNRPVMHAVRLMVPRRMTEFLILDEGSLQNRGVMTEQELIRAYLDNPTCTIRKACASLNDKKGR